MWIFVEDGASFATAELPDWVGEWMGRRRKGATQPRFGEPKSLDAKSLDTARDVPAHAPADPAAETRRAAASARRAEDTLRSVRAATEDLEVWVADQLRTGLAGFLANLGERCRRIAARLVDAKAAALASRVDEMPSRLLALSGEERVDAAIAELGRLVMLARAWRAEPRDVELRREVVSSETRDEVLADEHALRVASLWEVLGERIATRRDGLVSHSTFLMNEILGAALRDASRFLPGLLGPTLRRLRRGRALRSRARLLRRPRAASRRDRVARRSARHLSCLAGSLGRSFRRIRRASPPRPVADGSTRCSCRKAEFPRTPREARGGARRKGFGHRSAIPRRPSRSVPRSRAPPPSGTARACRFSRRVRIGEGSASMPELALSLAQLRGAWMAGRSALEHCPAEWRDAIGLGRAESTGAGADSDAECALAALAGHATMVLFRPAPAAPLAPRPLLPVLALPTIPESVHAAPPPRARGAERRDFPRALACRLRHGARLHPASGRLDAFATRR